MTADKHSVFGPSGAEKWLNCPGSIKAEEGLRDMGHSVYATEGRAAHLFAEMLLNGKTDFVWPDNEMEGYVREYVDYVKSIGGHQEYEQEVNYEQWVPGGFGTADAIITVDDVLHVIDLKYGKGVPVYAEENSQGKLYALGALSERDSFQEFSKVVIHIHQPRLDHVSSWKITPDNLYEWAEWVKIRAKLCTAANPERIPGEKQCRWCAAKPTCYALAVRTENALMIEFNNLDRIGPTAPENLRDEDLRFILNNKSLILTWLNSIEAYVKDRIESGVGFDGFKIVHGRSNRKWGDEAKAEKKLVKLLGKKNAYNQKLLSVAQAEKALGKEGKDKIADLIVKPEGAPTLVQDTNNREAISMITPEDF